MRRGEPARRLYDRVPNESRLQTESSSSSPIVYPAQSNQPSRVVVDTVVGGSSTAGDVFDESVGRGVQSEVASARSRSGDLGPAVDASSHMRTCECVRESALGLRDDLHVGPETSAAMRDPSAAEAVC